MLKIISSLKELVHAKLKRPVVKQAFYEILNLIMCQIEHMI